MPSSDIDQEKARQEQKLRIQRQITLASGLFEGDVTVHTLLESLAEGVIVIDSSRTILLVNTAAEQMFGYQRKRTSSASPKPFSFPNASVKSMKSIRRISSQSPGSGQ